MEFAVDVLKNVQRRAEGDGEILVTVVVEIDEKRAGGNIAEVEAKVGGGFTNSSVGHSKKKKIGQSFGLAEIKIFEAVLIEVTDGDAVLKSMLESGEPGNPVVGAELETVVPGRKMGEELGRDIDQSRPTALMI